MPRPMPYHRLLVGMLVVLACAQGGADLGEGADGAPRNTRPRVERTVRAACDAMLTCSRKGGWATAWTEDGSLTWGEHKPVASGVITVQPPATPTVAGIYLRAARLLEEPKYLDAAKAARDALAAIQTEAGGFPHEAEPGAPRAASGTFDDNVTTGALGFLIDLWAETGDSGDLALVKRVGEFMLAAQYPCGGWPQAYPPGRTGYDRCITFNDGAMTHVIKALLRLHGCLKDDRYLQAAIRGGDCIIHLQGGPGEEIWAAQYDPETLKPAWARKFEPPGYSASESSRVCHLLVELCLETGLERFLEPLPKAFAWYDAHRLRNGKWARFYEPGTQRPVYGRRDRQEPVYDYTQAAEGYTWQGDWFPAAARDAFNAIRAEGLEAYKKRLAGRETPVAPDARRVRDVCVALAPDGYWPSKPGAAYIEDMAKAGLAPDQRIIRTATFCANMTLLLDYLERTPRPANPAGGGDS